MPDPTRDRSTSNRSHGKDGTRADEAIWREALLATSVAAWLHAPGPAADAAQARALSATCRHWLEVTPSGQWAAQLDALAQALASACGDGPHPPAGMFVAAFGRTLLDTAIAGVEREAARAGHLAWYRALQPFLDTDPSHAQRNLLTTQLDATDAALALALSRLRRRLRERIEAALRLWAPDRAARDLLRRRLRDSLTVSEPAP